MKHVIPVREYVPQNPSQDQISDININLNNVYDLIESADLLIVSQENVINTNTIIINLLLLINVILIISIFIKSFL